MRYKPVTSVVIGSLDWLVPISLGFHPLHPRIAALGKHPYPRLLNFPQDESKSEPVNALWQQQKKDSAFVPSYTSFFPEYYASALQTETIIRDIVPITSKIYGTEHGRYAREINGQVIPTPVWITEVNTSPKKIDPDISATRALEVKAKAAARYYCFYSNKGVEKVYLYSTNGEDTVFGTVQENFQQYAQRTDVYPLDDSIYLSTALKTIGHIVNQMEDGIDRSLTKTRQLEVISISDSHNNYQFEGNNTPAYPHLFNRDVFTFLLPFQVNANKMKIALVHDYLIQRGGAERVFELICGFFPEADIYTSVYSSDYSPEKETVFTQRKVNTSFLQSVPGVKGNFRLFAPLYYPAFRALDLLDYDLIFSSSTSFAKGVRKKPGAMHICFCHNITRFLWNYHTYLEENSGFKRFSPFIKLLFDFLRKKDLLYPTFGRLSNRANNIFDNWKKLEFRLTPTLAARLNGTV